VEYIEATLEDIETANRLAHEGLGRTLDELPPQTRRLLGLIHDWVTERCQALAIPRGEFRFSRRDVREQTGWGNTQLKIHLHRLEELEYLLVHRGGRGQAMVYELLYNGEGTERPSFLMGLIDGEALKSPYDDKKSGENGQRSGSSRPPVGGESGPGRSGQNGREPSNGKTLEAIDGDEPEKPLIRLERSEGSYHNVTPATLTQGGN